MKYLIFLLTMIFSCQAFAQQDHFTLNGKVASLDEGIVYLRWQDKNNKTILDSASLDKGRFRFNGTISEPTMAGIYVKTTDDGASREKNYTNLFLEPDEMQLAVSKGAFDDARLSGSATQLEYDTYQQQVKKIEGRWSVVMDTLTQVNKRSNFEYQALKDWVLTPYFGEIKELTADFIREHPSSYVTAWLVTMELHRGISSDSLKKIYAAYPEKLKQNQYGQAILTELENRKKGVPGAIADVFSTRDIKGSPIGLTDFKGKYLLLDFWASWCLPCRKLNPHLKELYAQYKDKGFEIIGIASDDTRPDAWKAAVAKDGLPWRHVLSGLKMSGSTFDRSQDILDKYNVASLPTQILIDPAGKIIGRYGEDAAPHEALDKQLATVFAPGIQFSGTADAAYNGSEIVIYNHATGDHDSVAIKDGRFSITVPFKEPSRYYFYSKYELNKNGGYSPFGILVAHPGAIRLKADMSSFGNTVVSGSRDNDLFQQYSAVGDSLEKKIMDQLTVRYGAAFVEKPDQKSEKYKDLVKDYEALAAAGQPAEIRRMQQFIDKNSNSFAAVFVLDRYINDLDPATGETLYGKLAPAYKQTSYGKHISDHLIAVRATAIGNVAPEFQQADTAGKMVKLSEFRGKYLLIDFWASWCMPCRQENPNVVKAFRDYKGKNFTILGVSLDRPGKKEDWLKAIHDDHLEWTHVSDLQFWNNAVAKQYDVQSVPSNFLVGPDGKILAKNLHGDELEKKLAELLGSSTATTTTPASFHVQGQLTGKDVWLYLYYNDKDGKNKKDSCLTASGKFSFSGIIDAPVMTYLVAKTAANDRKKQEANSARFFLSPGEMELRLTEDDYAHARLTGSPTQEEYLVLEAAESSVEAQYKSQLDSLQNEKDHDKAAAIRERLAPYFAARNRKNYEFFSDHPQSPVTAYMLRFHVSDLSLDSLQHYYDGLGALQQQTAAGRSIASEIEKVRAGSPGSLAKDFTTKDLHDRPFTLSAFKGKSYVLIDFWASWCVPCRHSNPHLIELYHKYHSKGLEIVGVSDDDGKPDAWKKAVEKDGIGIWYHVLRGLDWEKIRKGEHNEKDISEKFGIHSLPTKILVDKNGMIIGRYGEGTNDEAALDKKLEEALTM